MINKLLDECFISDQSLDRLFFNPNGFALHIYMRANLVESMVSALTQFGILRLNIIADDNRQRPIDEQKTIILNNLENLENEILYLYHKRNLMGEAIMLLPLKRESFSKKSVSERAGLGNIRYETRDVGQLLESFLNSV